MENGTRAAEPSPVERRKIDALTKEIGAILKRNQNEKFLRAVLTRALTLEKLLCR